jgi:hypothetical protein
MHLFLKSVIFNLFFTQKKKQASFTPHYHGILRSIDLLCWYPGEGRSSSKHVRGGGVQSNKSAWAGVLWVAVQTVLSLRMLFT